MAAKKYPTPSLDNVTPMGMVDMIADYREKQKEAKFYEGFYKTALEARIEPGTTELRGEKYCAEWGTFDQEKVDVTAIREAAANGDAMAIECLKRFVKVTTVKQMRTKEIAVATMAPPTAIPASTTTQHSKAVHSPAGKKAKV